MLEYEFVGSVNITDISPEYVDSTLKCTVTYLVLGYLLM